MSTIAVEPAGYDSATQALVRANESAAMVYESLTSKLGGFHALGGDDTSSEDFVKQYDGAAAEAVNALAALVGGLGTLGEVTSASVTNHRSANTGSVYGRSAPSGGDGTPVSPRTVAAFTPPTSLGGDNDDMPDWWNHVVDHLQGFGWPSANTDQLRDAATAWRSAGNAVGNLNDLLTEATTGLGRQRSPEISVALQVIGTTRTNITELDTHLNALGDACDDYATQVDQTRETIKDLLKDLAIECGVTAGVSVALSFVTFGGAAAVGAGVIAARAIKYAHRILTALRALKAARAVLRASEVLAKMSRLRRAFEKLKVAHRLATLKTIASPKMTSTLAQLERKFKHAEALGVQLPRGKKGFEAFKKALDDFLTNPATKSRNGLYHGQPATLSFDVATGRCVVLKPDGSFWTAWKLGEEQLNNVIRTGRLGGN